MTTLQGGSRGASRSGRSVTHSRSSSLRGTASASRGSCPGRAKVYVSIFNALCPTSLRKLLASVHPRSRYTVASVTHRLSLRYPAHLLPHLPALPVGYDGQRRGTQALDTASVRARRSATSGVVPTGTPCPSPQNPGWGPARRSIAPRYRRYHAGPASHGPRSHTATLSWLPLAGTLCSPTRPLSLHYSPARCSPRPSKWPYTSKSPGA